MGYLSTGFLILFGDIAVKWYKKLDSQQGKSVVK